MLSTLFYRNSRLTWLAIGFILLTGLIALSDLGRQEDPVLVQRFGNLTTLYPGASAQRVEALVTRKLEEALAEVPEIKQVESLSRGGVSEIFIELKESVSEGRTEGIWSEIRDKIAGVTPGLPPGALAPQLEVRSISASTLVVGLYWDQDGPPEIGLMTRLAKTLEEMLGNLPGAEETGLYGEAQEEIRVLVDAEKLAQAGLPAAALSQAIAAADAKAPAGRMRGRAADLPLEVSGELDSIARVRAIPLVQTADGRTLRAGDIATVVKTVAEPPSEIALVGGKRGIVVTVVMEPDLRVDLWADMARRKIEEFRAEVPSGIGLTIMFDQSVYTVERLSSLLFNLLIGAGIVVGVLFVMMGWRSALIVGSALPLTLLLVLAGMNLLGLNLHQISVTGLIVALGLLIDNAIVATDDYTFHRRNGLAIPHAISKAIRHLAVPLFASTATTALAFAPIALAPGGTGEFIGEMAVAVILSIVFSFLIAMTIVPALAGYFSAPPRPGSARPWWREGVHLPGVTAAYRRLLAFVVRRPAAGIGISLLLPLAGFLAAGSLVNQFFPPVDRNQFQVQMSLPPQTSIAETYATALRAREILAEFPEIGENHWFIGVGAPRVFYNTFSNQDAISSFAGGFVYTSSAAATNDVLPRLQMRMREAFPNAQFLTLPFEQGPPFDAPVELKIIGPDTEVLRLLGEEVRAILSSAKNITYTQATLSGGAPKLVIAADEEEAKLAGFELTALASQLSAYLDGVTGGSVLEATEELPVRVQLGAEDRARTTTLGGRALTPLSRLAEAPDTDEFAGVPLAALAKIELKPELSGIARLNGERVNHVLGYIVPFTLPSVAQNDFNARLAQSNLALPPGYRIETGGEAEESAESVGSLASTAVPLLILMVTIVVLSFNSFAFAGVVFLTGFLSVGLALFGVWLFGYPLGFTAIVGTLGLVGLAINGTIVVLSNLRADEKAAGGDREAMVRVTVNSTRHILATTLTTMGGLAPLIVFGGTFWPPFATAIVGGVSGSAILALIMAPSFFAVIRGRKLKM
jgi:multidrug efflux pump